MGKSTPNDQITFKWNEEPSGWGISKNECLVIGSLRYCCVTQTQTLILATLKYSHKESKGDNVNFVIVFPILMLPKHWVHCNNRFVFHGLRAAWTSQLRDDPLLTDPRAHPDGRRKLLISNQQPLSQSRRDGSTSPAGGKSPTGCRLGNMHKWSHALVSLRAFRSEVSLSKMQCNHACSFPKQRDTRWQLLHDSFFIRFSKPFLFLWRREHWFLGGRVCTWGCLLDKLLLSQEEPYGFQHQIHPGQ